jgi:hypothetical protein
VNTSPFKTESCGEEKVENVGNIVSLFLSKMSMFAFENKLHTIKYKDVRGFEMDQC